MCKHVPVKPCQPLIGVCIAEEEVLEPTAKGLKSKYTFVLSKKIFDGFVFARNPHPLEVEISRSSDGTVDGVIDLVRSGCVWPQVRNDSRQTPFNRRNERSDTGCFISAVEASRPPALRGQFPGDFEQEA